MDQRYSLRFETGERRGEEIPIPAQGITVGRRPGNSLQILDNSVSGKHAELLVDGQGVLLRDLGSTNGTRIGLQRVIEHRLAHGDRVLFGNVELAFHDARVGGESGTPSATSGATPTAVAAGDGMQRTSAELVLRSHKRSRLGLVVIGVLALGTAGLYWWLQRQGLSPTNAAKPVEPVDGNLLAESYSFEGESDTWTPMDGAPAVFLRTQIDAGLANEGDSAPTGSFWMSGELARHEWACHRSPAIAASAGHALQARAKLFADALVPIQLGLEFSSTAEGGAHSIVAWGKGELTCAVPVGYDSVRAIVASVPGTEGGRAAFDDVSVVDAGSGGTPATKLGEFELALLGDPPSCAVLSKSGRIMVSGLTFGSSDLASGSPLEPRQNDKLTQLIATGGGTLRLVAEAPLAHARIATIGASETGSGFAAHALDFERADVTDLILGSGRELLRLKFEKPVRVRGVADGAASRIAIDGEIKEVALQHDFSAERTEAGNLAHTARNAEKKGELGNALKVWADLLNGYPYEDALVTEAESSRSRLIQQGLEELRGLRVEVERARFFRLVDLHRQCRDKARAIGARYSPSEVEPEAAAVAADVEKDLAGLEAGLMRTERARLSAIHKSLLAQKAEGIAAEVASYLAEKQ